MQFDFSVLVANWPLFAGGLARTIALCAASACLGLALGVVLALGRLSRRASLRVPAVVFIEIVRDTPFLVQAFLIFFGLPALGFPIKATTAGILSLSLYAGAYFAESIRGAILSVYKGQMDAARAVGMSYLLGMRRVVFPQMMGYLIPPLTNQLIGVVKDSSVLAIITVPELTMLTQSVFGTTFAAVEVYTMVAVLYWLLTATIAAGMGYLERRTPTYRITHQIPAVVPQRLD
jgi:His/Glu/Gln/Arg/opine family amino acid ABC transporter permease subunit